MGRHVVSIYQFRMMLVNLGVFSFVDSVDFHFELAHHWRLKELYGKV